MSGTRFVVTDIDNGDLPETICAKGTKPMLTITGEENINGEGVMLYESPFMQQPQQVEITTDAAEASGSTDVIPESSAPPDPLIKEQTKKTKLIQFKGAKRIPAMYHSKYKTDKDGNCIKFWECTTSFRQMSTLSQHRTVHSQKRPFVCEVCEKTFNRVSTLISHKNTHSGLKIHRCHICKKAFHQKGNLRHHIFIHTNERPYKCDQCQKGFNQMSNLICHKFKAHHLVEKPKFNCQLCRQVFEKRIQLKNHEQYEHGVETATSTDSSSNASVKYTNGVLVAAINTEAMRHAIATDQVPFALLKPSNRIPVLVRVLPAGDKQMLVPATVKDLKKYADISIKAKEEQAIEDDSRAIQENLSPDNDNSIANISDSTESISRPESLNTIEEEQAVQIHIPIVACVVQRCRDDGTTYMDIESPGPKRDEKEGSFIFTATD